MFCRSGQVRRVHHLCVLDRQRRSSPPPMRHRTPRSSRALAESPMQCVFIWNHAPAQAATSRRNAPRRLTVIPSVPVGPCRVRQAVHRGIRRTIAIDLDGTDEQPVREHGTRCRHIADRLAGRRPMAIPGSSAPSACIARSRSMVLSLSQPASQFIVSPRPGNRPGIQQDLSRLGHRFESPCHCRGTGQWAFHPCVRGLPRCRVR